MATTLTHHHQHQLQLQPQHFPHQIPSQSQTTSNSQLQNQIASPGHLCKDCNMLFESSTSLEVHLSYHKENLLTKWGTSSTENMDKSHLHSSHPPASPHNNNHRVHIDVPTSNNNSSRTPSSSDSGDHGHPPHYFPSVETHGHYLISQYNNNTGDHHLEPAFRPGAPNFGHPPVDTHGHIYGTHNNIHHPPYSLAPGQNQLFSPNSTQNNVSNGQRTPQPPPPNPGGPGPDPPVSREAAEILDLDSHKVHIYQQQQQQLAERNFFHRPYLSHLLPPQPSNGWPPGPPAEHQFVNNHNHGSAPFPGEHQSLPGGAYPPPSNTNGPRPSIPYDLGSNDLPNAAYPPEPPTSMGYPPLQHPNQHHLSQSAAVNFGASISGAFPPGPPPPTINGDSESNTPSARRTPPEGRGGNKSAVKTKGWKGVDAKRPKTYNCTACNKWFTSSGHLKRHYGTTLHKNSIKQKGGVIEEKPPVKSKGGKKSPGDSQQAAGSDSMHSSSSSSPGRMNIKVEDGMSEKSNYCVPSSISSNSASNNNSSNRSGDGSLNNPPSFNPNLNNSPPVPVPSPNSPYNIPGGPAYLPYSAQNLPSIPTTNNSSNSQHQPPHQQYSIPGQQFHPSPSTPYMNGFVSDSVANGPNGSYNVAPLFVPTTIYNGGGNYSSAGVDGDNTPLPPFSSVGFSHYDPNSFQLLNASPNNANPSAFPPNPSPNRVTPPYQPHHQHLMGSTPSPATSHNNNENHHSMESVRSNRRGSPDDFRYHPTSGSNEGSLDGVENSEPERDSSPSTSSGSDTNNKDGDESNGDALKCPDCSKTFVRACYLTQHANSSHSGGKPFKCNSCGKRFSAEPALTEHIAKHGEEKPYKCKLCPKQFNHKTDLRRHNCLHTGEKPFVCHICQKGFIRKDHMTKHCETHLRKKGSC